MLNYDQPRNWRKFGSKNFEAIYYSQGRSEQAEMVDEIAQKLGMSKSEALRLKWVDIDLAKRTVRISPEKGSSPREIRISTKLMAMLNLLPKTSGKVFSVSYDAMRKSFGRQREGLQSYFK